MDQTTQPPSQAPIAALVVFTLLHGLWYAALVHPWQAPDEYIHYEYMRMLEQKHTLFLWTEERSPAIQKEVAESMQLFQHNRYRGKGSVSDEVWESIPYPLGDMKFIFRPPLYFLLSLPIYWATAGLPVLSQLYFLRLFSIGLHCLTVWLTYLLGRTAFKGQASQRLALTGAVIVALHPQYTFISATFNDDSLPPPLIAFALYALLRGMERRGALRWYALAVLSGALALAAKRTSVAVVPLLAMGLVIYGALWLTSASWVRVSAGFAIIGVSALALALVVVILIAGPGLPSNLALALRVPMGALAQAAAYLRDPSLLSGFVWRPWVKFTIESFWAQFGWLNIRLSPGWIRIMLWGSVAICISVALAAARAVIGRYPPGDGLGRLAVALMAVGLLVTALSMAAQFVTVPEGYTPQGRYLFPFIGPFGLLMAWGWLAWWPRRWQGMAAVFGLGLLLVFDTAGWLTIASFFYS